jgi:hypothetical protein
MQRIFVLQVPQELQPKRQAFSYPSHNRDYGIEQDFVAYLDRHPESRARSAAEADWHYLPVFWTRWHLNHDYGRQGREVLQARAGDAILDDSKTFTVCQYDDGPLVGLGHTIVYLGSRQSESGRDAPLLCARHRRPWLPVRKRYQASFCGRLATHPLRHEMAVELDGRSDIAIVDGHKGAAFFVAQTMASRIALAPRGYGGSSFRFYEAMQLGVVPLLLGDVDTRPFKGLLPWSEVSFYARSAKEALERIDEHGHRQLTEMGRAARRFYETAVAYGRWCPLLLKELESAL